MGKDIQFGRVTYQQDLEGFVYESYCGLTCDPQPTVQEAATTYAEHLQWCKDCREEQERVKRLPNDLQSWRPD